MALKIVFNNRADLKLDKILNYLKSEWSVKVANEFLGNLYNLMDILSVFPEIGTIVDIERNIRAFLVTSQLNYIID